MSLSTFFDPKNIAVIGVSSDPKKLGAIIFNNIINFGYKGILYAVNPKNAGQDMYGKKCFKSISDIEIPVDLVIIVVPAKVCLSSVQDCVKNKSKNITIIAAGFGETGNKDLEIKIQNLCKENNINLLGPNSLGHISTYNNLNASFVGGIPSKGKVAFISQSGAYCSSMLDWANERKIGFSYFLSLGNKCILTEDKILEYLKDDDKTLIFVFYLESIANGTKFFELIKEISKTKFCIILIPGKSKKSKEASLSHTGSLLSNYNVIESAIEKSGAIQAHNTRELFELIEMVYFNNIPHFSGKMAILSNGGGVGVLSTDLCEENKIELVKPSEELFKKFRAELPKECSFINPYDILGDALASRYEAGLRLLCESNEYSLIFIIVTPQKTTEPLKTAEVVIKYMNLYKNINFYVSMIGGECLRESIALMNKNNIKNYEYPCDCLRLIGLFKSRERFNLLNPVKIRLNPVPTEIKNLIKNCIEKGYPSLPQCDVRIIMKHYNIDFPLEGNFTVDKYNEALNFAKKIFPNKVVLKLSSPEAIHKTEMKGIYLGIDNETNFKGSWESLSNLINHASLKDASINIQEMIQKATETIIGINTDPNFGKIMIFGTGGIYTEVIKDTSMRILPTEDFEQIINETKVSQILKGIRGEKKNIGKVVNTLKAIQQFALEIPEVVSIDANPVLVTEERAIVVDFKIILKNK